MNHLVLVDGSSFIHRSFHALPRLTRRSDAFPTGAIAGFCQMMWRIFKEHGRHHHFDLPPTHAAVVLDVKGRNFRHDIYPVYKANRSPIDPDLARQLPLIRKCVEAFSIECVEEPDCEADDVIATLTEEAISMDWEVTIVSSDKDLMQLVRGTVSMYDTMADGGKLDANGWPVKGKVIGREQVIEKLGVPPERVCDVLALMGDAVDNVPGVPGIGAKTAAELVNTFGSLEDVLANAGEIPQKKRREALLEHAEAARLSYQLVCLDRYLPIFQGVDDLELFPMDLEALHSFLLDMELADLASKVDRSINYRTRSAAT